MVSTVMMSSTPRVIPPPKSPALKRGAIALVMMTFDKRVGQRALEAIADLDAHAPLVRRDQQQHAVVLRFLAELPGPKQLVGVGFDLLTFERGDGGDDELNAGFVLEIRELRLDRASGIERDDVGLIDDAPGQRRESSERSATTPAHSSDNERHKPRRVATPART